MSADSPVPGSAPREQYAHDAALELALTGLARSYAKHPTPGRRELYLKAINAVLDYFEIMDEPGGAPRA